MEERILHLYGVDISVYDDGSVWIHRSNGKRRFGNVNKKGYRYVLIRDNGVERTVYVHRLVAKAFIPNPENKETINHINNDKSDNRPCNLEWMTNIENSRHRYDVLKIGSRKTPVLCVETGVIYETVMGAAKAVNGNRGCIHECIKGNRKTASGYHWKKVGGDSY